MYIGVFNLGVGSLGVAWLSSVRAVRWIITDEIPLKRKVGAKTSLYDPMV